MSVKTKCINCGKAATVFVSEIVDAKIRKCAYCAEHALQAGVLAPASYGLLSSVSAEKAGIFTLGKESLRCPTCSLSQEDFDKFGRFGCPECYETFGDLLRPLLLKLHTGSSHRGKIPRKALAQHLLDDRLKYLQGRLDNAVAEESYEDAADYRDKITEIKQLAKEPTDSEAN